jgi:hypothetical protein
MNIEERMKYAEQKRDEAVSNGTVNDICFWGGYIAALKAVERDNKNEQRKAD